MSDTVPPAPASRGRGAVVISLVAQATFLAALVVSGYMAWIAKDTATVSLFTTLCGFAGANATSVVNYWIGSSAGSDRKTELLAPKGPTS